MTQIILQTKETWWRDLTATRNLIPPVHFGHTWTVSTDLQLFFLSPLLLFPLLRWRFRFVVFVGALILMLNLTTFYTLVNNNHSNLVEFSTLARAPAWLVGLILGFVLQRSNNDVFNLDKNSVTVVWIVTGFIMFACIYLYRFCNNSFFYAVYEPVHRTLWALSLGWVIFSCHYGYSIGINNFLSHPVFRTLANLTYCAFIWHLPVETISKCLQRFPEYFNGFLMLRDAIANVVISLVIALPWSLLFELPFINLQKVMNEQLVAKPVLRKSASQESLRVYVY